MSVAHFFCVLLVYLKNFSALCSKLKILIQPTGDISKK